MNGGQGEEGAVAPNLRRLALLLLGGAVGVNHVGPGPVTRWVSFLDASQRTRQRDDVPFEAESDEVDDVDVYADKETCRALIPEGSSDEAHGASNVHGVTEDVEWESGQPS